MQVLKGMFCRHTGRIDDRWARFMKFQISRARAYFADAHAGVNLLDENARWPVWSALILYRHALRYVLADLDAPYRRQLSMESRALSAVCQLPSVNCVCVCTAVYAVRVR